MTPSEAAQRYALALPGVWLVQNNGSFSHFGGRYASPKNCAWAQGLLSESWDVHYEASLRERMKWLAEKGHSAEWFEWKAKWEALPAEERESDLRLIHVGIFQAEIGKTGLVAWDQVRRINLAGWGFLAGYLTEEAAWDQILPAAQAIQRAYPSWEAFGRGYQVGTAFWSAPRAEQNGAAAAALVADPNSPWSQIPWNTPLGGSAAAGASAGGPNYLLYAAGCLLVGGLGFGGLLAIGVVVAVMGSMFAFRGASEAVEAGAASGGVAVVAAGPSDWDGTGPFICKGSDKKTISGITTKLDAKPAIFAQGSCTLTIVDATIEAPVPLEVAGAAKVTISGGALIGSEAALITGGASTVTITGTRVEGEVKKKGASKIEGL